MNSLRTDKVAPRFLIYEITPLDRKRKSNIN